MSAEIAIPQELLVPPRIHNFLVNECGYLEPKMLYDGRMACLMPLMFTAAIITVIPATMHYCYEDRWCFHSMDAARSALARWDGHDEPQGWHRHPTTGRRRDDGDPLREYINP